MGSHNAVKAVPIRERKSWKTKPLRFLNQLLGMTRSLEKGKITLAPERNVGRHKFLNDRPRQVTTAALRSDSSSCADEQIKMTKGAGPNHAPLTAFKIVWIVAGHRSAHARL